MKSFKNYYEQQVLGVVEPIFIEGVGDLEAKIDSGNEGYNVLSAKNMSVEDGVKVRFLSNGKTIVKKIHDTITINLGANNHEDRYVVQFNVKFKNKFYENVLFSLGIRRDDDYPVLIGEPFLKQIDALIKINGADKLIES